MYSSSFCLLVLFGAGATVSQELRRYSLTYTVGTSQSDETSSPVWFRILGADDVATEWFYQESFPDRGETYQFDACLTDIGEIQKLQMLRVQSDHVVPTFIQVDDVSYTFTSRAQHGCCCYMLEVDFLSQDHSLTSESSSLCSSMDESIVPKCPTETPTLNPTSMAPSMAPVAAPTNAPTPSTCDYTHKCTAWGDPHITTFDGTSHHFQGEGYFDYVVSCDESNGNLEQLPFTISARHDYCLRERTCVKEVIVMLSDSANTIISFPQRSSPVFKDSGSNAVGLGSFTSTTMPEQEVSYMVEDGGFEIWFLFNGMDVKLKFSYYGNRLNIWSTDCLHNKLAMCGLCGNINNDPSDDFITCDTNNEIDTSGSSEFTSDGDAWNRVHEFGESCCNGELDELYGMNPSDCGDVVVPEKPDVECINEAKYICQEAFDYYCLGCDDGAEEVTNEWLNGCAFDLCEISECLDSVLGGGFGMIDAYDKGCLDTSVTECYLNKFDGMAEKIFSLL